MHFQFQNGSIKRTLTDMLSETQTLFQFQNGSIKRLSNEAQDLRNAIFNSKMVRLKDWGGKISDIFKDFSIPKWFD